MGSDDLKDFYHSFRVPDSHADANHIHGVFKGSDFLGFNAYQQELHDHKVVGCFRSPPMGAINAVELAQHVHTVLLSRAGVLHQRHQVCYKRPLPDSELLQLLLLAPCSERCTQPHPDRTDLQKFAKAKQAHSASGSRTAPRRLPVKG